MRTLMQIDIDIAEAIKHIGSNSIEIQNFSLKWLHELLQERAELNKDINMRR